MMHSPTRRYRDRRGFTLIEILVVLVIIALITAAALRGGLLSARGDYKVGEAARELQSGVIGTRDAAIRANAPRGIRLLPDPVLSPAPYGTAVSGSQFFGVLASNRFIAIEPAPDYKEGMLVPMMRNPNSPYGPPNYAASVSFLQVMQAGTNQGIPNEPTAWAYNIRQGDKIRFNESGAYYTVAGPMQLGPSYRGTNVLQNSERYINDSRFNFNGMTVQNALAAGIPYVYSPLLGAISPNYGPDYLNLVNGVDDDGDGWIDEGFDGIDNDGDGVVDPGFNGVDDDNNGIIDDPGELLFRGGGEYEPETFLGNALVLVNAINPPATVNPYLYTIFRRPIVSPGAREVTLPDGIVIDMTTSNAASATPFTFLYPKGAGFPAIGPVQFPERSRLPVDPYTYYVDIMVAPSGQVVQAGAGAAGIEYNSTSPTSNLPFYHFWLTEREGVVPPLFGYNAAIYNQNQIAGQYVPNLNPNYPAQTYLLPMPKGTTNLTSSGSNAAGSLAYTGPPLTGERRLVTLFTKSGQVVTNSIEFFDLLDANRPFYDAQAGIKESQ